MILRDYQKDLIDKVYTAWSAGHKNVLAVLPTGGGKTILFSNIINDHSGITVAIAHRQELVSQISLSLAKYGAMHHIIGQPKLINSIVKMHVELVGRSFYDPDSSHIVVGVDTLARRTGKWMDSVGLWVLDEGHHLLRKNKWGKVINLFKNARGLAVTATPFRADGRGLGTEYDGMIDTMVCGLSMRDLIDMGYLSDYRVFMPPTNLDLSPVTVSKATGDYNPMQLKTQVRKSKIIGDIVGHYKRYASGKLGVTFVTDVETATEVAADFNASGVPAAVVTAKTPDSERTGAIRKFRNRKLLQLVNVDIFGEGFDLPALEVVSMARPTKSLGMYRQQFGRGMRMTEGKNHAIIIDHVGNIMCHGLPDAPIEWSLKRRERKSNGSSSDLKPVKNCLQCTAVYDAIYKTCPFCGYVNVPAVRSGPEFVDGDLTEISPEVLMKMRGEIDRIDAPESSIKNKMLHAGAGQIVAAGAAKQHRLRKEAQQELRRTILGWAGRHISKGREYSEIYRRFYHTFKIDVLTAQTLGKRKANELKERIEANEN